MNDNSGKLTAVIVLLSLTLLTIIGIWVVPKINISRKVSFETTAITGDLNEVTINWTAKYTAPIILPRTEKLDAEQKIALYGELRIHAFAGLNSSEDFKIHSLSEIQKAFDGSDQIRMWIRLIDKRIDNLKSIEFNSIKTTEITDGYVRKKIENAFKL